LETVVKKIDDFLSEFFQCIKLYQHHAFITRAQYTFYSDTKQDVKEGEVLVVCDFAENYSFVVQDEIQSFYWNNEMASFCSILQNRNNHKSCELCFNFRM
jgi:hypothetical protein